MKRNFQTLVVFHQFLIFGLMVVESLSDGEIRSFLGFEKSVIEDPADVPRDPVLSAVWWGVTILGVLASLGVVLFSRWGRALFVFVSIVSVLLLPIGEGFYVGTGWMSLIGSTAGILEGMIISLMFFSPLRRLFRGESEI